MRKVKFVYFGFECINVCLPIEMNKKEHNKKIREKKVNENNKSF